MWSSQPPPTLLSLLLAALSNIETAQASPLGALDFNALLGRQACASYCGADNQFCCTSGQSCTTNAANIASCVAGAGTAVAAAGTAAYTTTWTETDLHTYTSTYYPPTSAATSIAVAPTGVAICNTNNAETSCGPICCASNQRCETSGQCIAYTSTFVGSSAVVSSFSAPQRPTSSGGVSTATSKVSVTTTQPFQSPATASGSQLPVAATSSKGLSPGAIAGIVIGVLAGIVLLILICFCCIAKAGLDAILGIFGIGKRRRRSTERVETVERYSRHGSGTASRRDTHRGWFGMGGGRPTSSGARVTERRKSRGFGGIGAIGAALLGLAVILGLKRHDRDRDREKRSSRPAVSDVSSSYYSYTDTGTSASSASSDRRTRDSRRTRETRYTQSRR